MDAEQESRVMNTFLAVAGAVLVVLLLELIWGAQWRWLATSALIGVAALVAVPFAAVTRRPSGIQPARGDVDAAAWGQVIPVPATVAPERKPFPIPEQPINPPKWEPGRRQPTDEYFDTGTSVADPQPEPPPTPPRSFSPVADPAGETLRWPRPTRDVT